METKLYDVFLSHASADKPAVEGLAERLEALGLKPFLDKWHLVPGAPWQEGLEEALDQSCTCAVFLGPGGLGPWQNEEMRAGLEERVRNPAFRVIPVLLPEAPDPKGKPLPRFLQRLTWVDFRVGLESEEAFRHLVCGILGLPPRAREGRRAPRIEARLGQLREDLETVETARRALGDELADRRKAELEAELEALSGHPVIGVGPGQGGAAGPAAQADQNAPAGGWEAGLETLLRSYLRSLAEECAELPLGVIDTRLAAGDGRQQVSLSDIYVDLDVVSPSARAGEEDEPGRWALRLARGEGEARTAALEAVALPENRLSVLVGEGGSGKTTFAHYLVGMLAGASAAAPTSLAGLLPVRLVLREVAALHLPADAEEGRATMLWQALAEDLSQRLGADAGQRLFPRLQERLLGAGCLFVLDGLDEVPEARQRRKVLLQAVRDLARSLGEPSRLLVAARPYAYADPQWKLTGFATLALAPFDADQVERFVGRWYQAVPTGLSASRETARERGRELSAAIAERSYLGDLATRPLLLTLMASLHSSWGKLPEDRADLYGEIVRLLMGRWQRPRTVRGRDGEPVIEPGVSAALQVGEERICAHLEELAFQVHRRQGTDPEGSEEAADITEAELLQAFKSLLGVLPPEGLLTYLRDRAGLLVPRREGVYAFPHRSFQEYMAASYLANRPDADMELRRWVLEEPTWWREVFLLAVGKARQGGLSRAVSAVRTLLSACPEGPGDLPWRLAALAGEALVELRVVERAGRDLPAYEGLVLKEARGRLVDLVTGGHLPPRERLVAADALGRLGDPRPGVEAVEVGGRKLPDLEWIEIPGGSFVIGSEEGEEDAYDDERPAHELTLPAFYLSRYPVTNAQFRLFVEAGGYENESYWTEEGWAWRHGTETDLPGTEEEWRERYAAWLAKRPKEKRHQPFSWTESPWNLPSRPVVGVTWYEALAFCSWLDGEVRRSPWWAERADALEAWKVRLPSEVEWEAAARGGEGRRWPWGNTLEEDRANLEETGLTTTSPVGIFPRGRNPFGLDDLAGNVYEWTLSRWGRSLRQPDYRYPYDREDGREDLGGWDLRVVRGGSLVSVGRFGRCAFRVGGVPSGFHGGGGFRCGVFPG